MTAFPRFEIDVWCPFCHLCFEHRSWFGSIDDGRGWGVDLTTLAKHIVDDHAHELPSVNGTVPACVGIGLKAVELKEVER